MYWDSDQEGARFKYKNDVVGYHPYLSVALSALGYLLFALVIYASHKKGIFKNYAHTIFLILAYGFAIDIFETGQTLYFIFNMPDENSRGPYNVRTGRYDVAQLPTTVLACTLSSWLFVFHWFSIWVDAIVSIYQFVVRFCGKEVKRATIYITFGTFLTISVGHFASAFIVRDVNNFLSFGPVVCNESYTFNRYVFLVALLSCFGIALITPVFPILTLIKSAFKKHNDIGLTTFLLISSLPASSIMIREIIFMASNRSSEHKDAIVLGFYSFQQFRFPILCILAMLIVKEIRDAVFSAVPDIIRKVFKRDISVTINVDLFHLETGETKHLEKNFTI